MEKHHCCINSRSIIQYVKDKKPEKLPQLFMDLGPEISTLADPEKFLSDENNWISSDVMSQLYDNAKVIFNDNDIAYKIGFDSVIHKRQGYVQKILVYAFGSPQRAIKHVQKINDHYNRTKTVELTDSGKLHSVVRLKWDSKVSLSRDFCLMNKGIYTAIPTIWGLPQAKLVENKCFFKGDAYCEYYIKWGQRRLISIVESIFFPWKVARESMTELERDKELLKEKYEQLHSLNIKLNNKVQQLTSLHETSTAALSTLHLDELLDIVLNRLLQSADLTRACIFLSDREQETLTLIHAVGTDLDTLNKLKGYQIPVAREKNIIAKAARSQTPIVIEDVSNFDLNPNNILLQTFSPKSFLVIPLTVRGKIEGILVGDNSDNPIALKDIDIDYLAGFGNQIAMAIDNANLYQQLRSSERKYREIVENAHIGVWVLDESANFTFANRRMRELVNNRIEIGASIFSLLNEDQKTLLLGVLVENMKGRPDRREIIFIGDDENVHTLVSSVPVFTGESYSGSFAMVTDLTEQKKLESKMLHSQKMEAVGTMAGGIAHDFNNILTCISGYSQLLKDDLKIKDPNLVQFVDVIFKSTQKASAVVKQLLAFSRGRQNGEAQPTNINNTIQESLRLLSSTLGKNITIDSRLASDLPLITCDATMIQQAFLNLCMNAKDAMAGEGLLTVVTAYHPDLIPEDVHWDFSPSPGKYVSISITDSGCGISPNQMDRIFDPFYTTKELGKGTGLGLAMVYGIVKKARGFITVASQKDQGTTFTLYFPRTESEDTAFKNQKTETAPTSEDINYNGTGSILVVDDDELIREFSREILTSKGYEVYLAGDGIEAIHMYQALSGNIDLVIMNLILPNMSGSKAIKKLRELNPELKVIVCSGFDFSEQDLDEIRQDGIPIINKPFQVHQLLSAVQKKLRD